MNTESTENQEEIQEEVPVQEESQEEVKQEEPKVSAKDYNFRRVEEKMRNLEAQLKKAQEQKQEPQEEIDEEEILTVGQLNKILEKERRSMQESQAKRELDGLEDRLQSKFSDFKDVVSEEAVEELMHEHPELYNTLKSNPDPYQKAVSAYKILKNMKKSDPNAKSVELNKKKIDENRQKPNMASTSSSVLSQANGWVKMSKDQKSSIYKEMKEAAAKRG